MANKNKESKLIKKIWNGIGFLVPGSVFSQNETHFRISFANKDEILKKAVEILNKLSK